MDDTEAGSISLSRPEAGDQIVIIARPEAAIELAFEPETVVGQYLAGQNVVIEFDNGGRIMLVGYGRLLPGLAAPETRFVEEAPDTAPASNAGDGPESETEIVERRRTTETERRPPASDVAQGPGGGENGANEDGAETGRQIAEAEEGPRNGPDGRESERPGSGEHGARTNDDPSDRGPPDPHSGRAFADASGFDFQALGVSTGPLQGNLFDGFSNGPLQTTEIETGPPNLSRSVASNDLLVNVIALDGGSGGPNGDGPTGPSPVTSPLTGRPLDGLVIEGTPGDDVLIGTDKGDHIIGFEGDDTLLAGNGYNLVDAGSGNDFVRGGPVGDVITGGAGHDVIATQGGPDIVSAGTGNDITTISGIDDGSVDRGEDYTELDGGEGFDTLIYAGTGEAALLDLRIVGDEAIGGFEHFDLRGTDGDAAQEANTLALNIEDVLEITGLGDANVITDRENVIENAVLISGDSLDFVVTSDDFTKEPRGANVTVDGNVYDLYVPVDPTYDVLLLIQQGVNVPEPE